MTQWCLKTMEIAHYPASKGASVHPRGSEVQGRLMCDQIN